MRSFLLSFPNRIQVFLVTGFTMLTAFVIAIIFSQFFDNHQLKANTDLISSVYEVMGTIYAILLTFTLWGVWQTYTEADNSVQKEAYALLDLVHIVEASPRHFQSDIRAVAVTYAEWVIKEEWRTLKDITSSAINLKEQGHSSTSEIINAVQNIKPTGDREMTIFSQALTILNNWLDARRTRILIARGNSAKALWPLLAIGAFVLFSFHGLFVAESIGIWIALLGGVSMVIGLTFYLIFTLDCPFAGTPSIDAEPFHLILSCLKAKEAAFNRTPVTS